MTWLVIRYNRWHRRRSLRKWAALVDKFLVTDETFQEHKKEWDG